ncbi:Thymidylate kinase-like protein [Thermogladius calderae 1633]|uniref:Thymidylate kinase-like protein n=1 Tax=Thermogladius calderae (strain DSM 22663 / VKM B-2946 / 1633) TaxID=1184251 RepID=I3TCW2_THEC1|nr:thymidylate kinase-like protein [Thermogladius calderae]AFK50600.1 Thymidylate kinase-like protein [Thermogladius calderae 1633]
MGRAVVLSGCDGSGKTTIVRLLSSYLASSYRASTHWLRGSHLHVSLLYRLLSKTRAFSGADNPYYKLSVPPGLRGLFALLEFTGFLPQLFARRLRLAFSDVVVCDRGVLDFLVWVSATLKYKSFLGTMLGKFLLALALKERPVVLTARLDVLRRRADVPSSFLKTEYAYYSVLARYLASATVNTSSSRPARTAAEVLSRLEL